MHIHRAVADCMRVGQLGELSVAGSTCEESQSSLPEDDSSQIQCTEYTPG